MARVEPSHVVLVGWLLPVGSMGGRRTQRGGQVRAGLRHRIVAARHRGHGAVQGAQVADQHPRLGIDVGAGSVLERYQRWRRFDTMAMGVATDGLNRLFSNNSDVLRLVRDMGLGLVDRMPNLKGFFIREAAGLTGDVPKLLKGEAL